MGRHKGRPPSDSLRIDLPEDGNIHEALWRLIKRVVCMPKCVPGTCAECDEVRDIVAALLRINYECRYMVAVLEWGEDLSRPYEDFRAELVTRGLLDE